MNNPIFDYRNQAWTAINENGQRVYQRCGHSDSVECGCYGRKHAGELSYVELEDALADPA